jgi:hypothetical protein
MEHKGVQFTVLQTANPTGWQWTVILSPPLRSKTGKASRKEVAVSKAIATINNLVARTKDAAYSERIGTKVG